MSRRDHRRVVLVVKRGGPKVNQSNVRVEQDFPVLGRPLGAAGGRGDVAVVCKGLVVAADQEDVLGLEVGMDEVQVVEKGHGSEQLPGKGLDVGAGERREAVALEKVKDAGAEQVGDDADVIPVVETLPQVDAVVAVVPVVGRQSRQDAELDAAGVAVLLDRSDDLDGDSLVGAQLSRLDDLSEGALAEQLDDGVCLDVSAVDRQGASRQEKRTLLGERSVLLHNVVAVVVVVLLVGVPERLSGDGSVQEKPHSCMAQLTSLTILT